MFVFVNTRWSWWWFFRFFIVFGWSWSIKIMKLCMLKQMNYFEMELFEFFCDSFASGMWMVRNAWTACANAKLLSDVPTLKTLQYSDQLVLYATTKIHATATTKIHVLLGWRKKWFNKPCLHFEKLSWKPHFHRFPRMTAVCWVITFECTDTFLPVGMNFHWLGRKFQIQFDLHCSEKAHEKERNLFYARK